jgi:iron complex transport system substrate-binding protein
MIGLLVGRVSTRSCVSESCARRRSSIKARRSHFVNRRTSSLLVAIAMMVSLPAWASRMLTDEAGRHVVVPDHPKRVVCLEPSVTDTVFAMGAGDAVVAVSDYTKYPKEALAKPSIGDLIHPSIERIVALHPDLVIGSMPMGPTETVKQLERLGIAVYVVNPQGIAGILHATGSVGDALNRRPAADALVQQLQTRVDAVRRRTQGLPRPTVLMPVWYDPITTIGRHAFITEVITAAGGRSMTDDIAADWPEISMEAVIERAPEALLLVRGGKTTLRVLQDRPGWNTLPAVRMQRVYYVDDRIDFPSPVAIDALEELARQFHP